MIWSSVHSSASSSTGKLRTPAISAMSGWMTVQICELGSMPVRIALAVPAVRLLRISASNKPPALVIEATRRKSTISSGVGFSASLPAASRGDAADIVVGDDRGAHIAGTIEHVQAEMGRQHLADFQSAHAVAVVVERRRESAEPELRRQCRDDAAADTALGRHAY